MRRPERVNLSEPLESVALFFGLLMLFAVLAGAALVLFQPGSTGPPASLCLVQPAMGMTGAYQPVGATPKPGSSLTVEGTVQGCLNHPSAGQWILYALVEIPSAVVWAGVVVLLWWLMRTARRDGPFTRKVATAMRRLGWFLIGGSVTVSVIHTLALGWLLISMMNVYSPWAGPVYDAIRGVLPVPLLAGAALLTMARVIRLGAAMDDEIKATV